MTRPAVAEPRLSLTAGGQDQFRSWRGPTFMAIGIQDPVLGASAMHALARQIHGCPPPLELAQAGYFVQEWGEQIATAALAHFGGARSA